MGLYLSTYAGPVIFAKFTTKQVVDPYRACSNVACKHKKAQDGNFCRTCGAPIEQKKDRFETVESPSYADLDTALSAAGLTIDSLNQERFMDGPVGHHVYTANARRNAQRSFHPENPSSAFVDLSEIDTEAEKAWLLEAFAPEIAVLRSIYEEVSTAWIFATWQS